MRSPTCTLDTSLRPLVEDGLFSVEHLPTSCSLRTQIQRPHRERMNIPRSTRLCRLGNHSPARESRRHGAHQCDCQRTSDTALNPAAGALAMRAHHIPGRAWRGFGQGRAEPSGRRCRTSMVSGQRAQDIHWSLEGKRQILVVVRVQALQRRLTVFVCLVCLSSTSHRNRGW
ncbi:hypothetical protein B0H16DRAFT_1619926 [Mycena metata]|uniref:Uncharacterized protein n=1 Tax=Mycena metata TaxID=1033252 RepID=A0AAD7MF98_9AGAR|nr:hypothetical protein B0H16DRAFT_1619926 [Mycena metata]